MGDRLTRYSSMMVLGDTIPDSERTEGLIMVA